MKWIKAWHYLMISTYVLLTTYLVVVSVKVIPVGFMGGVRSGVLSKLDLPVDYGYAEAGQASGLFFMSFIFASLFLIALSRKWKWTSRISEYVLFVFSLKSVLPALFYLVSIIYLHFSKKAHGFFEPV